MTTVLFLLSTFALFISRHPVEAKSSLGLALLTVVIAVVIQLKAQPIVTYVPEHDVPAAKQPDLQRVMSSPARPSPNGPNASHRNRAENRWQRSGA